MLNILFMGTPDFAEESLKAIYNAKYNIIGVVTNPDKPKGRGMKMLSSPVKKFAQEMNIPIYQPLKVKNNIEFIKKIKLLNPDLICVVAYGKILPKEILDIPRLGCINVHGSLLPKYRGAAPIQWAVINGDKETGVTTMYMNEDMDTGDIILKEKIDIGEEETTGQIWERLSKIGGKLLVKTIKLIEEEKAPRQKQSENFSMAPMINKQMAQIDWENKTAKEIKNLVRGLNPTMGAYTLINGKKLKIWQVKIVKNDLLPAEVSVIESKMKNGDILLADEKKGLFFKAKDGILEALEIQAENCKRMNPKDFLRGNKL